ncbi:MAG: DUF167 domain-containing protein [bacterium]
MRLNVKVIPNAKRERLVVEEGRVRVYLTAPAVEGKANKALINFLAAHFRVKKNMVTIISGQTSRVKLVDIEGITGPK